MVIWTEYFKYRARLRGFDLAIIEEIVRFSEERFSIRPRVVVQFEFNAASM